MQQILLHSLPQITLVIGIIHLCMLYLTGSESVKNYVSVARFWLLSSLFCSSIFYDKSLYYEYFQYNAYTFLWILAVDIFTYILLEVSATWFSSQNRTGCKYYALLLGATLNINLWLAAKDLLALGAGGLLMIIINYYFLNIHYEKQKESSSASLYIKVLLTVFLLLMISVISIYRWTGQTSYQSLHEFLTIHQENPIVFTMFMGIIVFFLCFLGIAPFHILAEEKTGKSILPVAHYFAIIMPLALWGVFIKINLIIFSTYTSAMSAAYMIFALLSVLMGAIGANSRINLHRIYAYGTLYHFGIILLLLSLGKMTATFATYIYLMTYLIGLNGAYLFFYSLKSYGEYLSSVTVLSGLAKTRPCTMGILLISLFSLIGFPPLAGFLGQLSVIYELLDTEYYACLFFALICLLLLAKAYLEIIRTAYFDEKNKVFDRESSCVLFYAFINAIFVSIIAFNPLNITEKLKDMFYVIFL